MVVALTSKMGTTLAKLETLATIYVLKFLGNRPWKITYYF
jgi:hypothetical protein